MEIGLYYFEYPNELVHYKLNLPELLSGNCGKEQINDDLRNFRESACTSPLGAYHLTDLILAGLGLICSLAAPVMALRQSGRLRVSRSTAANLARLRMLLGLSLILFAAADFLGFLNADGQPLDWSEIIGMEVPGFLIDIILLSAGIRILRKALKALKRATNKADRYAEPWETAGAGGFKGSLEKRGSSGPMTVGDLRSALQLDEYEDIFQVGTSSTQEEMKVGRLCHYCNGQGCGQCGGIGETF
uniref:Uncharacterized protein n=1 Tax=uncultured marine group II/III euryarchaeote KM3_88_E02 TaxID=1456536 RepID=A0A075I2A5_9EURY|nr:hypothetical protein [uncultured marine group II/III euryarchaeote KM3_88_E02]